MFDGFKSRTLYFRLFTSYLLIYVISLGVMTGFLYKTAVVDLQREIENSNLHKIIQLKNNVDIRFKELEMLALRIRLDPGLTPLMMSSGEIRINEGIDQLATYRANSAFIDDLAIYYRDIDRVTTISGLHSLPVYLQTRFQLTEDARDRYTRAISIDSAPSLLPPDEQTAPDSIGHETIMYVYPIFNYNGKAAAAVFFLINRAVLDDMVSELLGDLPGEVRILDVDNRTVLSSTNGTFKITEAYRKEITADKGQGIRSIQIDGRKISFTSAVSDYSKWRFIAAVETQHLYRKPVYMRALILQILVGVLAFGILGIAIFSKTYYKPVKKLLGIAVDFFPQGKSSSNMDEMEQLQSSFENTIVKYHDLQDTVDNQKTLLRDQVLMQLLQHGDEEISELNSMVKKAGIPSMDGPAIIMIILKPSIQNSGFSFLERETVEQVLYDINDKHARVYTLELLKIRAIAAIVQIESIKQSDMPSGPDTTAGIDFAKENDFMHQDNAIRYFRQFAHALAKGLEELTGDEIMLGAGTVCSNLGKINRSYIEAMAVLEDHSLKDNCRVVFFYDLLIDRRGHRYWYPVEDQLRFSQGLKQGDRIVAVETLQRMMDGITEHKTQPIMIRYVCFDLINMVIKTLNEMNIGSVDEQIRQAMDFTSPKDLYIRLEEIVEKVCADLTERESSEDRKLYHELIAYIEENYTDANLSLKLVADNFEMPDYYISRFFKLNTGHTFSDYLAGKKLELACDLLETSRLSVREIVTRIGYTDLTSFMRKFKKHYGITPGQYRDTNTKPV